MTNKELYQADSQLAPFIRMVLPNGLTALVKEVHTVPIVAVYFWTRTGSVNEPPEVNGISHFFEHMFFKGTRRRGVGEMDRVIKALGGYNNAFTGMEYTAYYVVVPSENFTTAFDVLFDAMVDSIFDPDEIERERQVILEEINRHEDHPHGKLSEMFTSRIFAGTPYERPILGTAETLHRIGREDFLRYLRAFYRPDNVTAVVVGDVETGRVLDEMEGMTGSWRIDGNHEGKGADFTFTPQGEIRQEVAEKDVNQGYWTMGFPNLGRRQRDEMYALDVASTLLGGGKSSRLHQRLVEREGLASTVSAWVWALQRAGAFGIDADFQEGNRERIEGVALEEVDRLRREPVADEELRRAKTILKTDFAYTNETDSNIAATLGRYETVATLEEALTYADRIARVTAEDIRRAMQTCCDIAAYTACYIKPKT